MQLGHWETFGSCYTFDDIYIYICTFLYICMWERLFLTLTVASNMVKAHDYRREDNYFLKCRLISAWKSSQSWGPGLWCRQSFRLCFHNNEHSYTVNTLTCRLSWRGKTFEVSLSDLCRRAGRPFESSVQRHPLGSGCCLLKKERTLIPRQLKIPVKNIDKLHAAVVICGEIELSILPRDPQTIPRS